MNKNFEGIRDYIVLHYKTNSRSDSQYWIDNRENQNLSNNLKEMLNCWYGVEDIDAALTRLDIGTYYSQRSWACLLAGVGTFPREENLISADLENAQSLQDDLKYVDNFIEGCSLNFEPHENMLTSKTP